MQLISWAVFSILYTVQAHIYMLEPKPFDNLKAKDKDPLNLDMPGNYPCKFDNSLDFYNGESTRVAANSKLTVTLTGTAIHGGGSCQFSISQDKRPSWSSVFKVLQSIQGQCPNGSMTNNLPPDQKSGVVDRHQYSIHIHSMIPSGLYTFAWTWFNQIGNREMYMACAPIEVTDGGQNQSHFDSLPNMVVANIWEAPGCKGPPNYSCYSFPHPGEQLVNNPCNLGGNGSLKTPQKVCTAPLTGTPSPAIGPYRPPTSLPSGSTAGVNCVFPCSKTFTCINETHFGICAHGCMVPQHVANGTHCVNDEIVHIGMTRRDLASHKNRKKHNQRWST